MSKEEEGSCKLNPICKHKERKPKKPHYIPRPWGKPYNYKCFQCPFTCMEKSHLYNHMKYSLCKNSLSLLIESDWPYKKNNFLIPEMHLLQEPQSESNPDRQETCDSTGSNAARARQAREKGPPEGQRFMDEDDEREEEEDEEATGQNPKEKGKVLRFLQGSLGKSETNASATVSKGKRERPSKEGEPEFIITDVYSLEGQFEKEREEQRLAKASKKASGYAGVGRTEQWKLLPSSLKKGTTEVPTGANIIPCYPPPTYTEYQEPQGLSLLGINYPLNTNLFSYLNPVVGTGATQLPFLASTAQLMHPTHTSHFQTLQSPEQSSFIPRFYYPLLFEHAFNSSEGKLVAGKSVSQAQPGPTSFVAAPKTKTPVEPMKVCLHKAPEDKNTVAWGSGNKPVKQNPVHNKIMPDGDGSWPPQAAREAVQHQKQIFSVYTVPSHGMNEGLALQRGAVDGPVWANSSPAKCMKRKPWLDDNPLEVLMDQTASLMGGERPTQKSSCSPRMPSPDDWHEKTAFPNVPAHKRRRESEASPDNTDHPVVGHTSALIGDLSRTLEEYGKVEKRLANLASEDSSRQKVLSEQLGKIRLELLNIHHALEKASCPHEGPLDLSVKRSEDTAKEVEKVPPRDDLLISPPTDCSPRQLVKVELLSPDLVTCYARPTKCEADSSVLVCPDGRGGNASVTQTLVSIQEEGGGIGGVLGFGRGRQQMESV